MKFGSLFAGIGGIDLGLECAGMECAWQVEIDEYCSRVLEKHWPEIKRYGDVRECGAHNLETVDLIAGGFPCQPHSVAGKRKGAADDRNLWPEFSRVIAELKPQYVLAENVPGIITTYLDTVLSDLESQGYICATLNLPAVAFDAPHRRERIFIVAHTEANAFGSYSNGIGSHRKKINERRRTKQGGVELQDKQKRESRSMGGDVAHADESRSQGSEESGNSIEKGKKPKHKLVGRFDRRGGTWWSVEPNVGRVAHGIPSRVDRLRGLGNAVVPQVAEWIGQRIMAFDND